MSALLGVPHELVEPQHCRDLRSGDVLHDVGELKRQVWSRVSHEPCYLSAAGAKCRDLIRGRCCVDHASAVGRDVYLGHAVGVLLLGDRDAEVRSLLDEAAEVHERALVPLIKVEPLA